MAAVWEPFYFQGNKLLEIGDKLLGRAAPGKTRDRMVITFDKVIFKDGTSLPIQATAQDIDGTYGVKGIKIGDVLLNSAGPLLLDTAASFFEVLQDVAKNVTIVTGGGSGVAVVGGGNNSESGQNNNPAQTAAETGVESGRNVFDTISELLSEDIVDNQPYVLIPAGTRMQAMLLAPMDISKAGYGK
jgi:type IV secretion system protein VirB10